MIGSLGPDNGYHQVLGHGELSRDLQRGRARPSQPEEGRGPQNQGAPGLGHIRRWVSPPQRTILIRGLWGFAT